MTGQSPSCGACKFLRRRCTADCIFAPYFSYEQAAAHFSAVHKVFGASNVSKLLSHLPAQTRSDAAVTISYEALARMHDPIYGCVAHIFALQQQVASLKDEIETIGGQMAYLGADITPYAMGNNSYLAAQSGITGSTSSQQNLSIQHSKDTLVNTCLNSLTPIQELNQDYYLLDESFNECCLPDEPNPDCYDYSPWMNIAP